MDNITHSLAGLLLASATIQLRKRNPSTVDDTGRGTFTTVAAITGVVGANLPDSDVLWIAALQVFGRLDALGALLHHRGHTHTLFAALIWVPLLSLGAVAALRRGGVSALRPSTAASDSRWLILLSAAAVLSHLLLDGTNDYGVHPLSPFSNRWFYGDSVFIIEPWLWVVAIPALLRNTARRAMQVALTAIFVIGIGLSWAVPQVPVVAAAVATIGAAACVALTRRQTPAMAVGTGIGGWTAVTALFALGSSLAREQVLQAKPSESQAAMMGRDTLVLRDVIVSPTPANPLCSRVITIEASAERYRLNTAWVSAVPSLLTAARCARAVRSDSTSGAQHLQMQRSTAPASAAVQWGWTWEAPRAELASLLASACDVAGWMRFARAPFWVAVGADSVMVGDLRYDRDRGVSVARFTFPRESSRCAVPLPSWLPPRRDLWPELDA